MNTQGQSAQTIAEEILAGAGMKSETGAPIKLQPVRVRGLSSHTSKLTKLVLTHFALKVAALLTSLIAGRWDMGAYLVSWSFLTADFMLSYFCTGRKMLSKKLWTIIDPEGNKTTFVESGVSKDGQEEKGNKCIFWGLQIAFTVAWGVVFIVYLCSTKFEWIMQSIAGTVFNAAVIYSFKMMYEDQCCSGRSQERCCSARPEEHVEATHVHDTSANYEQRQATDGSDAGLV